MSNFFGLSKSTGHSYRLLVGDRMRVLVFNNDVTLFLFPLQSSFFFFCVKCHTGFYSKLQSKVVFSVLMKDTHTNSIIQQLGRQEEPFWSFKSFHCLVSVTSLSFPKPLCWELRDECCSWLITEERLYTSCPSLAAITDPHRHPLSTDTIIGHCIKYYIKLVKESFGFRLCFVYLSAVKSNASHICFQRPCEAFSNLKYPFQWRVCHAVDDAVFQRFLHPEIYDVIYDLFLLRFKDNHLYIISEQHLKSKCIRLKF